MLEKAQRQLANRRSGDPPHSSARRVASADIFESQEGRTTNATTDDGLALDDAENPLQLLARASDLQLTPLTTAQNQSSNASVPFSSPGTTTYSSNSTRAVDSFFVPIRASLDTGPELDPVDLGLVTLEEVTKLFSLYDPIVYDL